MKIYFTAAISDIPSDHQKNYQRIVEVLKGLGYEVKADHIIGKTRQILESQSEDEAKAVARKLISWKHQADLVVSETSYPSFGVGQEISYALSQDKPVVALYLPGREPHLLTSIGEEYLYPAEYEIPTLKKILSEYVDYAKEAADTRFNFFVSSEINAFLDWVAKARKIPRAVFLRQLIEEDMRKNKQYLREIKGKRS